MEFHVSYLIYFHDGSFDFSEISLQAYYHIITPAYRLNEEYIIIKTISTKKNLISNCQKRKKNEFKKFKILRNNLNIP